MRNRGLRRRGRALALPVFLLAPVAANAQELDAGHLHINVDGRRVGTERFQVWRTGSTVNAVARIEIVQQPTWEVGLQTDAELLPTRYVMEGRGTLVAGQRFADRFRFHVTTAEGERWREYPLPDAGAILETGVAHHYLLLVLALREAEEERIALLLPAAGRSVTARLAGRAEEPVAVGEGSVAATRYDVDIDGAAHRVWLDADDRLLRVFDPVNEREAVRAPVES